MGPALSRERIFQAAVELADQVGLNAMSMRPLAEALGVTPMALYNHVANREALIDGMVDVIVAEIAEPAQSLGDSDEWRLAVRGRLVAARTALSDHAWALEAIESRTGASPVVLAHMNSVMGLMRAGGLSPDLVHHAMHALGERLWGITRDVFPTSPMPEEPDDRKAHLDQTAIDYPNIAELAAIVEASGAPCNADYEFEFAIDVLLDGFDRLRESDWNSSQAAQNA